MDITFIFLIVFHYIAKQILCKMIDLAMRYLYIFNRKNNNSMMYMFLCENFGFKLGNK